MMSILFPHLYEDVEFLIPPEADVDAMDTLVGVFSGVPTRGSANAGADAGASASAPSYATSPLRSAAGGRPGHENAVAGPSRVS
jgi:hypothetical protein